MVTIQELVERIEELDIDSTIYAVRVGGWTPESPAVVAVEPEDGSVPSDVEGMQYLLEVRVAREVLDWFRNLNNGRDPTPREATEAIIHYAVHDAL
jgi:hypothetical protein